LSSILNLFYILVNINTKQKQKNHLNSNLIISKTSEKFKRTSVNKNHNNKKVNTISFVEHSKPLLYTCKHKYKTKTNKKNLKQTTRSTFGLENIPRTITLFFAFIWKVLPLFNLLSFQNLKNLYVRLLDLYT